MFTPPTMCWREKIIVNLSLFRVRLSPSGGIGVRGVSDCAAGGAVAANRRGGGGDGRRGPPLVLLTPDSEGHALGRHDLHARRRLAGRNCGWCVGTVAMVAVALLSIASLRERHSTYLTRQGL